jgi:hypothetical protein
MKNIYNFILLIVFINCNDSIDKNKISINSIFNNLNERVHEMKNGEINYIHKIKPFMSAKTFRTEVQLIFNKTINNGDSICGYNLILNQCYMYMALNSNIYEVDSTAKTIEIYSIDTVQNTTFSKLSSKKGIRLYKPFVSNENVQLKMPSNYLYKSLSYANTYGENSYKIIFTNIDTIHPEYGYDSTIYHISKNNYTLLKYESVLFDSSEKNIQRTVFDSISYKIIETESKVKFNDSLTYLMKKGYTTIQVDPYAPYDLYSPIATEAKVPNWKVKDSNNSIIELNKIKSKLVLFDFSYLGCHYCMESLPMLNNFYLKYNRDQLTVCWIDPFDYEKKTFLEEQFKKRNIIFPVYYDINNTTSKIYGIKAYPYAFLVEIPSLKLLKSFAGYSKEHEKELLKIIEMKLNKMVNL